MNAAVNSIEYTTKSRPTQRTCIAVIWARYTASADHKKSLTTILQDHTSINSAVFSMKKPYLMVVRFNPEEIRGTEIVEMVNHHGADARLVGC